MIDFKDLLDYCHLEAISNSLAPTEESIWRNICRSYSKEFNTPLHLVMELPPKTVILNVYENQLNEMDLEDPEKLSKLIEIVSGIEDPEYDSKKLKEQEEFDKMILEQEEERIKSNKPIGYKESSKNSLLENQNIEEKNKPTGGYVNLSYLEDSDNEK